MTESAVEADPAAPGADRRVLKRPSAFRTIGEVAEELDLPTHVLRFWESKFPQLKPLKRGGGRRYYRPEDIVLLRRIRQCLYQDGYTIRGVQKLFREGGLRGSETSDSEVAGGDDGQNGAPLDEDEIPTTLFPLDPAQPEPSEDGLLTALAPPPELVEVIEPGHDPDQPRPDPPRPDQPGAARSGLVGRPPAQSRPAPPSREVLQTALRELRGELVEIRGMLEQLRARLGPP